ncbi:MULTISPECIES: hypothetical protein [unclassified Sulfurospirillum]|uniref:hypothetical protein n=1 Tax=unclassified Sulfurospirillum TaxID=2618290 RepID=UPI0004FFEAF4|nr:MULTISPECIES: hypothetical protein [unclassified Sulfurospirillum]KFL33533.1 hypothetical protein JU57_11070 [Sulfurospirillum sp. SCADC]
MRHIVQVLIFTCLALIFSGCSNKFLQIDAGHDVVVRDRIFEESKEALLKGDVQKAITLLNQATANDPMDARLHFLLGMAYHNDFIQGNFAAAQLAEAGYIVASQLDPSMYLTHAQLGRLYLHLKRFADAEFSFLNAFEIKGDDPLIAYELAYASYYAHDLETATKVILKAYELAPMDVVILKAGYLMCSVVGLEEQSALIRQNLLRIVMPHEFSQVEQRIKIWQNAYQASLKMQHKKPTIVSKVISPEPITEPLTGPRSPYWAECPQPDVKSISAQNSDDEEDDDEESSSVFTNAPNALPSPCYNKPLPRMVIIDATIIQTDEYLTNYNGLNLLDGLEAVFSWSDGVTKSKTDGISSSMRTRTSSISLPMGGITYSLNIANASDFRNHILAKPSLVALDRQPATFFSGSNILVSVPGQLSGGDLIEKSIGISLSVTPTFIDDDSLLLAIKVSRSDFSVEDQGSFQESLLTLKSSVSTSVLMNINQTLILSGLVEKQSNVNSSGVPVLKNIPGFNYLFNEAYDENKRKSLLIILTPQKAVQSSTMQTNNTRIDLFKETTLGGIAFNNDTLLRMRLLAENKNHFLYKQGDINIHKWNQKTQMQAILDEIIPLKLQP